MITRSKSININKRQRETSQTSSEFDSSDEDNYEDFMEELLHPRTRRHQRRRSAVDDFLDREELHTWDESCGITSQDFSDLSHRGEDGSQTPSDLPDSTFEVEWDSFVCEDGNLLPPSNWEEDFLMHKAKIMNTYSYKGWVLGDEKDETGDMQDVPWHPYDPDEILDAEFEDESCQISGREVGTTAKLCYGVVSLLKKTVQTVIVLCVD